MKTVKVIFIGELIVFFVGLMLGITGSSIGYNRVYDPNLIMDEEKILGSYRPIRADEWGVITLLAVAQYANKSQFPQLNKSLGVEGKKLAIVGMPGVPVKELSLLGKPATWGFFLFDLRRALSWYWLFPIFIAINGVWLLLNMLWPKQAAVNFCFGLYLAFSYYSVSWSFWPAWQIGLACLSTALFLFILKNQRGTLNFLAALSLGIFLAATALTIYPPWTIPLLTCPLLLVLALCIKERLFKNIYEKKWYLLLAASITVIILYSWYVCNSDAIAAMLSSTYPGQRRNYGGSASLFREFSGWLDPILIFETFGYLNSSEVGTYYSFILAILPLFVFSGVRKDIIVNSLLLYMLFSYVYMYIGVPELLGKMSLWNRTIPARVVIGVELCQVLIFAWLYAKKDDIVKNKYILWCSVLMPIVVAVVVVKSMPIQLMEQILNNNSDIKLWMVGCFILLCLSYFILMNKIKIFPYVLLIITLPITLFWHPLCIAPNSFTLEVPNAIKTPDEHQYGGRILSVVGDHVKANILAASGESVLNAVSYYVDKDIYNTFYKQIDDGSFNKYNHMIMSIDEKNNNDVESVADCIFFRLNPKFDFSRFKADYMVSTTPPEILKSNKSLEFLEQMGWSYWYKIVHVEK